MCCRVDLLTSLHVYILLHAVLPQPLWRRLLLLWLPLSGCVLAAVGGLHRPCYVCWGHLDVLLLLCIACSVVVLLLLLPLPLLGLWA
jgi:hypothetical protein